MTRTQSSSAAVERRISEGALLASIVESVDDAIFSVALDGIATSWNRAAKRLYGYGADEIIGRHISMLMPPANAQEMAGLLERVSAGTPVEHFDTVGLRNDGAVFPASLTLSPVRDDEGHVVGASLIERDVTKQAEIEERLAAASEYARTLIEASLDPLVTISPAGTITDVNAATMRLTGLSRESLVGTSFSDYFTEPEKARESYQRVFTEGSINEYPLTIRDGNGQLRHVLYNASVYRDTAGCVLGVVATARDVTDHHRAQHAVAEQHAREQQRIAELERFERLVVGRELRMIELKEEIAELKDRVRGAEAGT
jgi:PAS domain S-box-containing protein